MRPFEKRNKIRDMKKFHLLVVLLACLHCVAQAQVPDAVDSAPPVPAHPRSGPPAIS
jgi:hypothetical protein